MLYSAHCQSPLGWLTLAGDGDNLVGLWLEGQKYFGGAIKQPMVQRENLSVFLQTKEWLNHYFAGKNPAISSLPLAPIGGEFRQTVWKILCRIPYGKVVTYGEIARETAVWLHRSGMSPQAVGGAVGHNPISIIIPCHRVVGANGNLTGYAGGLDKKCQLLRHEGVDLSRFRVPVVGTAR